MSYPPLLGGQKVSLANEEQVHLLWVYLFNIFLLKIWEEMISQPTGEISQLTRSWQRKSNGFLASTIWTTTSLQTENQEIVNLPNSRTSLSLSSHVAGIFLWKPCTTPHNTPWIYPPPGHCLLWQTNKTPLQNDEWFSSWQLRLVKKNYLANVLT